MPKLNATHLPERLKEAIEQLESGIEVEAKKNKTLLNDEQRKALDDAWDNQQALRKKYKPPKTEEEKQRIGWKDKREVRIEIYKQAYEEITANAVANIRKLQQQREAKAARVYLEARFNAKDGVNGDSAGNIAMTRAGFSPANSRVNKRDEEVFELEEQLRKQFEAEMTDEEREQLELLKEHEKAVIKRKK
jgi:hypothetical protein